MNSISVELSISRDFRLLNSNWKQVSVVHCLLDEWSAVDGHVWLPCPFSWLVLIRWCKACAVKKNNYLSIGKDFRILIFKELLSRRHLLSAMTKVAQLVQVTKIVARNGPQWWYWPVGIPNIRSMNGDHRACKIVAFRLNEFLERLKMN